MEIIKSHKISKYIHSTFAEYFGSTIYDGIWVGKDSKIPNVNGLRLDVINGVRECGITAFRWPGGCCAEKYHWRDGIGNDRKPVMHFLKDSNNWKWDMSFGTDECLEFCALCEMEPVFVANVSSGSAEEFRSWFEYCNAPQDTKYGAMRALNGHPEPYNVKIWGIGNTDENTWKMSFDTGAYATEYLRFTSALDYDLLKEITTIGLGLSIRHGYSYWPGETLDKITRNGTFKGPDMLSVHHYLGSMKDKKCGNAVEYTDEEYYHLLDSLVQYQKDIDFHREVIEKHACKSAPTFIAFDEWGIWHDEATLDSGQRQRQTLRDAIFGAMAMHIFYRNADVVKMAMETQVTNLLQSLFETDGEKFMKTATFWVMKLYKEHKEQYLLNDALTSEGDVDAISSISEDGKKVVVTAVNKDLYKTCKLKLSAELSKMKVVLADEIYNENVRAYNTYENPNEIVAKEKKITSNEIVLLPHSIIRIVLEK